jgi:L-serine dehydratase
VALSIFDLFTIGIGPSSSHTVGPMRAARRFARVLEREGLVGEVRGLKIDLFGSLGATGKGHGTDVAVMLGLEGEAPETVDPELTPARMDRIRREEVLALLGRWRVAFRPLEDVYFHRLRSLPEHPNGMQFAAVDGSGAEIARRTYFSVGGGFVVGDADEEVEGHGPARRDGRVPHPFASAAEALQMCASRGASIADLVLDNETALWGDAVRPKLAAVWRAMQDCVRRGADREGILPGGLKVPRRAAALRRRLEADPGATDPLRALDWVNLWALAVNEENAAGGRVVTAPTNGAAGIVPAVAHHYARQTPGADEAGLHRLLLTAGAIGLLYKTNASISGAEVGCQGEVGVACSMAAAGLTEALGGTPAQVENAAEIGMEHNLGLTCDPVGGLVQVPCIERNAMGAVKAINAARIALAGDGKHKVSLDKVIATMRETGADMLTKYKETARGGLAVNIVEC